MKSHSRPLAIRRAIAGWFSERGWKAFGFQKEVWKALAEGRSGLLHATTGAGKTYAVWLGALQAFSQRAAEGEEPGSRRRSTPSVPLTVLWITPMRALAADTLTALRRPLDELAGRHPGIARWTAGARTGDTDSGERSAQSRRLPTVLVTTPESLSLMLARADAQELLRGVELVVADEWHELLGNKRGVQLQLAIARIRGWNPALRVWGMSATLGNLQEAMETLLGPRQPGDEGVLVQGKIDKRLVVDTLLPGNAARFSWAGHLGLRMLPQVVAELDQSGTTLVFVNVRSQAELWYKAILEARPDWAGVLAIHHGSLDRGVRDWVEQGLKAGSLKAVVCTSSLDLGVDFLPVERVVQIGSPKGVARLLQRAGRSGHAPGRPSRITLVPTHSLEIIEAAAARAAIRAGHVERRSSPHQPVDVLAQHLVTVALGGGFEPEALYAEVRRTAAYRELPRAVWDWCLDFVSRGGPSLAAYPDYHRVAPDEQGIWRLSDKRLARRHRSNIGTIVSDASMVVQIKNGARLGTMEESFLARLQPGDCFLFAGRVLEMVKIEQMTAYVKRATAGRPTVPRWNGSRMAISSVLAESLVEQMALAAAHRFDSPELKSVRPLLEVQQRWSALPTPGTLLAETLRTREGWHLFLYPFAGRHAHIGLASLFAWRAAQHEQGTFSIAINDYGLELISATPRDWAGLLPDLLRLDDAPGGGEHGALLQEVLASLNATEMSRRRFREIARVSGLIFQSHPGERRSNRQLQASSQLFFEVFQKYDSDNMLLRQADEEVLSQELDIAQILGSLRKMRSQELVVKHLERPSPFAFPLMIELFREKLTNENLADRIARMVLQLEDAADGRAPDAQAAEEKQARRPRNGPPRAKPPEPPSAAEQAAAAEIRKDLDFSLTPVEGGEPRKPRRERKPSRPLPLL
ncbi:ligase-associated DNA damage response DEXH box helicase [Xylophilus rhododendri]|uniref:Ligase-associated DNA damage response DEXH box helicase n=1 Tax=Xylophilus rhododendri TaxID=2697032 RepID=A0A857J562_9BURK|nr:ligase-associated DNA damage response DEXH box helicase [Xylophilus rhododendri]QHI99110.1 ligase-associated DNA damage response DEXH box helicase [Xylophilus rhododendri]